MILAFEYDNGLKFYSQRELQHSGLAEVESRNSAQELFDKPARFDLFLVRRIDAVPDELHAAFLTREEAEQEALDIGNCRVIRGVFVGDKAILDEECILDCVY